MTERRTFKKDVNRDAALVEAAMAGRLEPLVMQIGMSPNEAFVYHPKWLARQSETYRNEVVEAVIALQDKIMAGDNGSSLDT